MRTCAGNNRRPAKWDADLKERREPDDNRVMRTHFDFVAYCMDYLTATNLDLSDERWTALKPTALRAANDVTALVAEREASTPGRAPAWAYADFAERFVTGVLAEGRVSRDEASKMRRILAEIATDTLRGDLPG